MKYERILKSLLLYVIGILLLLLSVFLSDHISYNSHFISQLPIVLPTVLSLVPIAASVLFILDENYPYFFRTGMMSLLGGITLFAFGIISYSFAKPIVWASSLVLGVISLLGAFVRLIIQGGLSAYRKYQDKNQYEDLEGKIPYKSQYKNPEARKHVLWAFGIVFLVSGIAGISTSLISGRVYSFGDLISVLSIIGGVYFIYNAYREVRRGKA